VYVDEIFDEDRDKPQYVHIKQKETKSKKTLYHETIPLGKTYYKVLRG
jgi:KRAB domain-containing zinc finger protein